MEFQDIVLVDDEYDEELVMHAWNRVKTDGQTRVVEPFIVSSSDEAWTLTRESLLYVFDQCGWDTVALRSDYIAYYAMPWCVRDQKVDELDFEEEMEAFCSSTTTEEFAEQLAVELVSNQNCPLIVVNAVRAKKPSFMAIVQAIRYQQERVGYPPVRVFVTNDNSDLFEFHVPPSLVHRVRH